MTERWAGEATTARSNLGVGGNTGVVNYRHLVRALVKPVAVVDCTHARGVAELSFEGAVNGDAATIVMERVETRLNGGSVTERVHVILAGEPGEREVASHTWTDTHRARRYPREIRHGQIDAADLFSPEGNDSLPEAMGLLERGFRVLREALAEREIPAVRRLATAGA